MKIVVLYRPDSENSRITEEYVHDYQMRYADSKFDMLNIDSKEGGAMASLYDIMEFPTIVALRDDGSVLKIWQGTTFPLFDEIAAYAYS